MALLKSLSVFLSLALVLSGTQKCFADSANQNAFIKKGTMLVGKLVTPISSKQSKAGDNIIFKTAENFTLAGVNIIPKGTNGSAMITEAEKAGYFGQGGKIAFQPMDLVLKNGVHVPLGFETTKNSSADNDASMIAGVLAIGVFASFLHGSNQKFPAGTKFSMLVTEDVDLLVPEAKLAEVYSY